MRQGARRANAVLFCGVFVGACERVDLERMIEQPSYRAYQSNPLFDDGMAMRQPPPNTVPRQRLLGPPEVVYGLRDGRPVDAIPVALDRDELEQGRRRYDVFCAPCHGVQGDGRSPVARSMALRPPPSLVDPPAAEEPPGRVYRAMAVGYGLMPAYAAQLTVSERWAVVGYLEVLKVRREWVLGELPPELQEEALRWLP